MMFLCTEYLEVIAVRRDHLSQVDEDGMMEDVVIRRDKVLQINLLFLHFNSKIFNLRAFQTLSASNLTGNNDFAADGYSVHCYHASLGYLLCPKSSFPLLLNTQPISKPHRSVLCVTCLRPVGVFMHRI